MWWGDVNRVGREGVRGGVMVATDYEGIDTVYTYVDSKILYV